MIGSTLAELGQEAALAPVDREQIVKLSQRAVGRLIQLSDRLALASRLEQPFEIVRAPADLVKLTRETLEQFVATQLRQRIKATSAFPQTPVPVAVDSALIATALLELITNANRFARRQLRVEVSIQAEAAVIAVEDDGEGVKEDERPLLFEPFAERRSRTGLGMGLWLAQRLVELHGGTITVEPLAAGTRQRLTLPLRT